MAVLNNNYYILGEQIIMSSDMWVRVRMRVRVGFCCGHGDLSAFSCWEALENVTKYCWTVNP